MRNLSRRMMSTKPTQSYISCERRGSLAAIALQRPRALNALNLEMVRELQAAFQDASTDASVRCLLLTGEGKAFCAGGDVKAVMLAAKEEPPARGNIADAFFREEYTLNAALAASDKPQVSVWDGICMGGGAGLSVHGKFRVATEKALFAMPETNIGLFPDVGASHFLSSLPGGLGPYLALTGCRLGPADLLYSGLATHYVPSSTLPSLAAALEGCGSSDDVSAALDARCLKTLLGTCPSPPDVGASAT